MTKVKKDKSQNGFRAFFTLVKMQLKDKLDTSWTKSVKNIIRTVVLTLLKIIAVGAIGFVVLYLLSFLGIYGPWNAYQVVTVVLAISLLLSLISCTTGLTNSLYFSDDNKVLITLPVSANKLFISKIIVYYIAELKRSLTFLMPIVIACCIMLLTKNKINVSVFLWMWIPLIFIVALPVLLGALLSIPFMGIKILLNKVPVLKIILYTLLTIIGVALILFLIGLIPNNIDFIQQIKEISDAIKGFLKKVTDVLVIEKQLVYLLIGDLKNNNMYGFTWWIPLRFIVLAASLVVLFFTSYFISRPLFLNMMSKSFERNASLTKSAKNKKHSKFFTFINKELKINFRNLKVSVTLIVMYIIIPILILLLNKIFGAIDKSSLGETLACAFNMFMITLLFLSTNGMVASMYSKEGKAAYIKKTKPIYVKYPLLAKLSLNIILSIPTIFITVAIFGYYTNFKIWDTILFGFGILTLHIGHMLYSANLDIMNPKNEEYATSGEGYNNPNEDKATIAAFALSIAYGLFGFILVSESLLRGIYTIACLKLLLIGVGVLLLFGIIFFKNIKAYYYEG